MSGTQVATRFTPGVVAMLPHALDVSAGQFNACARVDEDGGVEVYCWGTNRQGMNGSLAVDTTSLPKRVPALSGAKSVVLSRITEHGCAILADDHVACWGTNAYGSLGHVSNDLICPGGTLCNHVPSPVGNDFKAVELALGAAVGCARVVGTGEVQCWGYNGAGMLGLGGVPDGNDHPAPAVVPGTTGATAIAAGYVHACAVVGGTLRCWGSNAYGELANGYQSDVCGLVPCKTSPQTVKDLPGVVVRISDGFNASFASTTDGKEWAWGANPDARLGHVSGASGDQLTCSGKPGVCNPVPQSFPIP
jgi:alpha-tubulin suppressor-like RCC1 family protein